VLVLVNDTVDNQGAVSFVNIATMRSSNAGVELGVDPFVDSHEVDRLPGTGT
jgi:hypothetical protein